MKNFYVITRFGLGQKNIDFYEHELSFAKSLLFPSIINQSDKDFTFLLLCDKKIPKEIINKVKDIFKESEVNLVIHLHDPFEKYSLKPDISDIISRSMKIGERITSVRVDIDDAISKNYIEIVKSKINAETKNFRRIHLTTSLGVYYYHDYDKFLLVRKPNYSVVAISDIYEKGFKNVYDYFHSSIYKNILNEPLSLNLELDSEDVKWLRTIRQNSITRANRGVLRIEVSNIYFRRLITSVLRFFKRSNLYPIRYLSFQSIQKMFNISRRIEILEVELPTVPKVFFNRKNSHCKSRLQSKQFFLDYCLDRKVTSKISPSETDINDFYGF